ncbi:MAG: radical SAM family heme chaperone HemW [Pseudomonadota bacterium]
MNGGINDGGFGVYVHWPFCASKCPYCDFNSHVRARIDEPRWRRALIAELDHYAGETPGRLVTSVFFGGGTPSLMEPASVEAIILRIRRNWTTAPELEITLEANPSALDRGRFAALARAGVNRLSLGVQSLDDRGLEFLGRGHDAAAALAAIALARSHFKRWSFDLIYALPGQGLAAWRAELERALALADGHLSVYQLTIEPGTAFHTRFARGELRLPPEQDAADLFDLTQDVLGAAGLPAYEISNHARPGEECRHNLVYWRYEDYVGVGPGAHGRLTLGGAKVALRQAKAPEIWLERVERDGHASAERAPIAPRAAAEEALMMGLRLARGIEPERFRRQTGLGLEAALEAGRLGRLIEGGFLACDRHGLRATPAGRKVLNAVLGELLASRLHPGP